jgi:MoaA/NifB/PqqE/SkfB family radical SAM enzyme
MQTTSVLIQSLCVPCGNYCRYCLLSWNGRVEGAGWERSVRLAERWLRELKEQRPALQASFAFGCSMEHPDLKDALRTLRRLGSPMADFLQCDGMEMRDEAVCAELMALLKGEGIRQLNFTVYGLPDYHDRFAGRKGDYALILRMMRAAGRAGIPCDAGIPLTKENVGQADELICCLKEAGCAQVRLFIPHEEGRGRTLAAVRLTKRDLETLSPAARALLNTAVFRTEAEWLKEAGGYREEKRQILLSLRLDNIDRYEGLDALSALRETEALDDAYYAAFPDFAGLAERYGDPAGEKIYRVRDLFAHYRARYAAEHGIRPYDVTDERFSGSRRS